VGVGAEAAAAAASKQNSSSNCCAVCHEILNPHDVDDHFVTKKPKHSINICQVF
jgi:hypothetical protein